MTREELLSSKLMADYGLTAEDLDAMIEGSRELDRRLAGKNNPSVRDQIIQRFWDEHLVSRGFGPDDARRYNLSTRLHGPRDVEVPERVTGYVQAFWIARDLIYRKEHS